MISGKAMNASPMPPLTASSVGTPREVARNPIAANTPMPASSSNEALENPAMKALPVRSPLRGR
jgi:hypothetical protein